MAPADTCTFVPPMEHNCASCRVLSRKTSRQQLAQLCQLENQGPGDTSEPAPPQTPFFHLLSR